MRKFFAVIKREYIQRVRTKFFVVATILGPLLMAGFAVVPCHDVWNQVGGPTRIADCRSDWQGVRAGARELAIDRRAASPTPRPKAGTATRPQ